MQLSENFTLAEFMRSRTACAMGQSVTVEPGSEALRNLRRLCGGVLQPVRDALGMVIVSSGYRPRWLNCAVHGSNTSDHMFGLAADINVRGYSPLAVAKWLAVNVPGVKQVIHERGRWVHVSIWPERQTGETQLLTAYKPLETAENRNPKLVYVCGLHEIRSLREAA